MANVSNYNNYAVWADSDTDQKVEITDVLFKGSTSNGDYIIAGVQNTFYNQLSLVTVSLAQAISAPAWQPNLDFANYSNAFKSAFNNAIAAKMNTDGTSAFAKVVGNATANYNYDQLKAKADLLDTMRASFYLVTATGTFNGSDIVITDSVQNVATRKANGYANAVLELIVNDSVIVTSGLYIYSTAIGGSAPYNGTITIKALNGMPTSGSYTIKIKVSDYSFRG